MVMEHINYWAVLVSAIVYMGIGAFWFSPMVFGKQWARMMKYTKKDMKTSPNGYLLLFTTDLVVSWVLAFFISFLGAGSWRSGASVGFMCWLGFMAPIGITGMVWEKKSFDLVLLQNSYCVLSLMLLGGLLAVWK